MYKYGKASNQSAFRADRPLTDTEIAAYAPSILADEAHESRGERYAFIPTVRVLDGLRAEGFQPFEVRQTRVRDQSKKDHTKHLIRLRHSGQIASAGEVPEIILINSHDGTSSYQVLAGIFRFVCQNGLIAGDVCNDIRIRHSGNVVDDVIEGSFRVLENIEQVTSRIDTYKSITLDRGEQLAFADAATDLRWGRDDQGNSLAPIYGSDQLNRSRRYADNGADLWSTFNRAQENLIKGGLTGRSASNRRTRTREVGGVNETVKLNQALWTLADRLAQYKTGTELKEAA